MSILDSIEIGIISAAAFALDWSELKQDFLDTKIQKAEEQAAIIESKIALHKAKLEAQKKAAEWQSLTTQDKPAKSSSSRW